jgi:hypothetical protein
MHPSGGENDGIHLMINRDCRENDDLINFSVCRFLWIRCFDFFIVCTFHSDLIVTFLSNIPLTRFIHSFRKRKLRLYPQKSAPSIDSYLSSLPYRISTIRISILWPPDESTPRTMIRWNTASLTKYDASTKMFNPPTCSVSKKGKKNCVGSKRKFVE